MRPVWEVMDDAAEGMRSFKEFLRIWKMDLLVYSPDTSSFRTGQAEARSSGVSRVGGRAQHVPPLLPPGGAGSGPGLMWVLASRVESHLRPVPRCGLGVEQTECSSSTFVVRHIHLSEPPFSCLQRGEYRPCRDEK